MTGIVRTLLSSEELSRVDLWFLNGAYYGLDARSIESVEILKPEAGPAAALPPLKVTLVFHVAPEVRAIGGDQPRRDAPGSDDPWDPMGA